MKGFQTKLNVIGNNIANVSTVGFKKSTVNFQDLMSQNYSKGGVNPMQMGLGSQTSAVNVIHTAGSSMTTGVGTDLSIMGDGFFVVQDPNQTGDDGRYVTRAGNFVMNAEGSLVTTDGYHVLDDAGAQIKVDNDRHVSFNINRNGEIVGRLADGTEEPIGTIAIASVPNPAGLLKFGGSLYEMTNAAGGWEVSNAATANTAIAAGMLEMSNVDLTEEFTEMIVAQRGFQANSRTISTSDEILQEIVNLKR